MSEQPSPRPYAGLWLALSLLALAAGIGAWIVVAVLLRQIV